MAQYSRVEVINQIEESRMIPLFYHNDVTLSSDVIKACHDGGARQMEFTNRGYYALEVFTEVIKYSINVLVILINFNQQRQHINN